MTLLMADPPPIILVILGALIGAMLCLYVVKGPS